MILHLSSDLMFQSKISSAARAAGSECMVDRSATKLVERVEDPARVHLVLIDLTLGSVDLSADIPLLHQNFVNSKVIAYGPHVDVERLTLAEECGADQVLTRGQLDREMTVIMQEAS
jgi:DNA-binding NtrC family response regulator